MHGRMWQPQHCTVQCSWCSWGRHPLNTRERWYQTCCLWGSAQIFLCWYSAMQRRPRYLQYALCSWKTDSKHQKNIIKYFRQVEELYTRFVDTDQIRLVKEAINFVEANTFSVPEDSVKKANSTFYGAYASGVNVYISNHWDEDYTY